MKFFVYFKLALDALFANKMRAILTMLGIIIGVASVITLMAAGKGVEKTIAASFDIMGPNTVFIQPSNPDAPGGGMMSMAFATPSLTVDDARALEDIPGVDLVDAANENFVEVIAGDTSTVTVIEGATENWVRLYGFEMAEGSNISDRHVDGRDTVVVLGYDVAEKLFGRHYDIVGERVKIKNKRFTVIGVMARKGGGMLGFTYDDLIIVPITTFQDRLFAMRTPRGEDAVQAIVFRVISAEMKADAVAEAEEILRRRHHLKEDDQNDFSVISPEQMLEQMSMITGLLTLLLGAIAAISLLVAGIGIMNIMLVSVTERTREIGLRKAVGARQRDILLQFLIEAGILSLVGGIIGITVGSLQSWALSFIDMGGGQTLEISFDPATMVTVAVISFIIGVISGLYPAMRAARLNPIDALRYG